jgi:hypothetical protein
VLAYWKFESISLQRGVRELSVPEEGYRSAATVPAVVARKTAKESRKTCGVATSVGLPMKPGKCGTMTHDFMVGVP